MDRRIFLKDLAALTASAAVAPNLNAASLGAVPTPENSESKDGKLITSAPVLQNFAQTSMGVAFAVSDMANGFVRYSLNADMSDAVTVKCGGYRVTDMNPDMMLVRLTGLKPSTRYYYQIGADRISYKGGYQMKILGTETDPRVYSFVTAGKNTKARFCVINDTHAQADTLDAAFRKISSLAPSCVLWNGDACNVEEKIEDLKNIFIYPPVSVKDFAAETPYLFCPGNHDSRGMAARHLEKVWMFRQPEERLSRDWDLGRNFAVRVGDIAIIGLDTAEDKVDENPAFAGLFNSHAYREAQVAWLEDALKRPEIKSAPFLVAACHIPLMDNDPRENPGDLHPNDYAPGIRYAWASWQRDCFKLWGPLLQKAGCQLLISAHQHHYRFDGPTADRCWAQMVGGTHDLHSTTSFPTVIEVEQSGKTMEVKVHNLQSGEICDVHTFKPRKK